MSEFFKDAGHHWWRRCGDCNGVHPSLAPAETRAASWTCDSCVGRADMARALMGVCNSAVTFDGKRVTVDMTSDAYEAMWAALRKAGALP